VILQKILIWPKIQILMQKYIENFCIEKLISLFKKLGWIKIEILSITRNFVIFGQKINF